MKIEKIRALRGPNIWTRRTVLEALVVAKADELPVGDLQNFQARLAKVLPAIDRSQPAFEGGGAVAQALGRVALALQIQAGCAVSFNRTVPAEPGSFKVAVEYGEEEVGRLAFEIAETLVHAVAHGEAFDPAESIKKLRSLDEQVRLGPSTGSIARAAARRGIPARRLNDGSLIQFGWGVKGHRILAAETDRTSAIAESIAQDKELTKKLLHEVGVPVPEGRPVSDAEDAWKAAQEIGLPVVVKPRGGNQGRGVACNLGTRAQVTAAYEAARKESSSILVERYVSGADYRLLVIGGKLVAAARREPPKVVGDGVHTVRQLVDVVNADPRRGEDHATSLSKIPLDAIAQGVLEEQRLTPDSVPEAGTVVLLRRNANLSTGGSATDVTDEVHPEVRARILDAVKVIGLDIAGCDVLCRDITRPLEEQGGAIVEINAAPGFRMHLDPSYGKGRLVGEAVIDMMFPEEEDGRIPVVAVSGTNGKTTTVRLIAHIQKTFGRKVGMTCTDGIYLDGRRIDTGDCSGPKSARAVLLNPLVEAAVLETARGGVLREGLGFDRCDVAVVTNIGTGDHLGMNGIVTAEQLSQVKRVIVENVATTGYAVLNAADALTAAMASSCPGGAIFFAYDRRNPVIVSRRAEGHRVIYAEGGHIIAAEGSLERKVVEIAQVPLTQGGRARFQVENCMAAVGAAWGLGLPWETVRQGLCTFVNDPKTAPGRFNVFDYGGATLVVDYGHNVDALVALVDAIEHMPHNRRVAVISAAGDRRDIDIIRQGEVVGDAFDEVVLFEDACTRGRPDGETLGLLKQGLTNARRAADIVEIRGEFKAIDDGLSRLEPGDIALVLIDQVEEALAYIQRLVADPPDRLTLMSPAVLTRRTTTRRAAG